MGNFIRKADMSGRKATGKKSSRQQSQGKIKPQNIVAPEVEHQDPEVRAINRLRKSLKRDLPMFLLNNVLLSVQFFENYEREVAKLNATPITEQEGRRNQQLREQQRHCITPDRLHELVAAKVLFRPQHGPGKHHPQTLHSQTLVVVQDNVQLEQSPESGGACAGGVSYELTIEEVRPGYVKLCNVGIPNKRRLSYEVIDSIDGKETSEEIAVDDGNDEGISLNDSSSQATRNVDQSNDAVENDDGFLESPPTHVPWTASAAQPTEGESFMKSLQEQVKSRAVSGSVGNLTLSGQESMDRSRELPASESNDGSDKTNFSPRHVFGPRIPESETRSLQGGLTATERRLSGILKTPKQQSVTISSLRNDPPKVKLAVTSAKSLPNLTSIKPSSSNSRVSPASSDSSGYKSNSSTNVYTVSLPNSRGSDSEYGYGVITELRTPKPVEMRRLGKTPIRSSEIPNECFWKIDVPLHEADDDDDDASYNVRNKIRGSGGAISTGKLFHTQYYLNSTYYMGSFADVFIERLFEPLGFTRDNMKDATMQGAKIHCEIIRRGPDSISFIAKMNVVPALACRLWPNEAVEWLLRSRTRTMDPRTHAPYAWPTSKMVNKIQNFGYNILPIGYLPTRGRNADHQLEWQLAFPQAEAYLESCLTHAQIRCYLFVMALYKSFLDPLLDSELSLSPAHIRTLLFWQCEQNYLAWPEDRPGETLKKFLDKIYDALSRERLPDYFLRQRNLFESTPLSHLRRVQEKLCRIQENLLMHVLVAARNLRYVNKDAFYPVLDYKQLYGIITTDDFVSLLNPMLGQVTRATRESRVEKEEVESEESDEEFHPSKDVWMAARKYDRNRQWHKKVRRQIEAEKAAQKLASGSRASTESIDVKWQPRVGPEPMRRKLLLELLIPHFIEMAARSNTFRAYHQAQLYLQHAQRLTVLLGEEPAADKSMTSRFFFRIQTIRQATQSNFSPGSPSAQSDGFKFLPTDVLRSAPKDLVSSEKLARNPTPSTSKSLFGQNMPIVTIAEVHNIRTETDTDKKPSVIPTSSTKKHSSKTSKESIPSIKQTTEFNTDVKSKSENGSNHTFSPKTKAKYVTDQISSSKSVDKSSTFKKLSEIVTDNDLSPKHNSKLNTEDVTSQSKKHSSETRHENITTFKQTSEFNTDVKSELKNGGSHTFSPKTMAKYATDQTSLSKNTFGTSADKSSTFKKLSEIGTDNDSSPKHNSKLNSEDVTSQSKKHSSETSQESITTFKQTSEFHTDVKSVLKKESSNDFSPKPTADCATDETHSGANTCEISTDKISTLLRSSPADDPSIKHNSELNTGLKSAMKEKSNDVPPSNSVVEADEESEEEWSNL